MELNPFVKIIWDPILSSSSGFVFHKKWNSNELYSVLEDLYLITPNWEEIKMLFQNPNRWKQQKRSPNIVLFF
ncbi:MAG: bifunctional hydroxymethylpyrimidine kinase/phosphomethylpyrimidine kinase [Bacteroidetes bacterium]|nr:bifunctional hydroxymethylpyrimidine kinase/phosphomethylpyrimidine kinase [Bacteroidota bacterium]